MKVVTKKTSAPARNLGRPPAQRTERRKSSKATSEKSHSTPASWNPAVFLIPHTTAPLASRVSRPPTTAQIPLSLQPKNFDELSFEEQEAAVLDDFLYLLMGYEGQHIQYSNAHSIATEKDRLVGPTFSILPGLDPSLFNLATTMLNMATQYKAIDAFLDIQSREECGLVNHALCAAIRTLMADYLVFVVQLETQFLTNANFTLHSLNVYTLPTIRMMFHIYSLTQEMLRGNSLPDGTEDSDDESDDTEDILEGLRGDGSLPSRQFCKGGNVLCLLSRRLEAQAGDPDARSLFSSLLRDASRPYMAILNEWLHHGTIRDPHEEFFVREQKSIKREILHDDYTDEYWEKRYLLREHVIPPQLEGVKEKILLAGKYFNVVRECGGIDGRTTIKDQDLLQSFDDKRFLQNITTSYTHANQSLLPMLLTTHDLPSRLRSLKHYFFLDQSDFFPYFIELGTSELRKPASKVNLSKLQSLLDLAIRQPGSVAAQDPFKEDVRVEMNPISLTKALTQVVNISGMDQGDVLPTPLSQAEETDREETGFTALQFDYLVPFPLSLIISRKTIWRYQALFRHLASLRHLEQQLVASWQIQSRAAASWSRRNSNPKVEVWKRRVFALRTRMLFFVQQVLYFCTSEVIEPHWRAFMAKLEGNKQGGDNSSLAFSTVDELMRDHVDFLDTCLKECMLTNGKLLKTQSKLLHTCTLFATYTHSLHHDLAPIDPFLTHNSASSANPATIEERFTKMQDMLQKFEHSFTRNLDVLRDALDSYAATETVALLGLCARLSGVTHGNGGG